MNQTAAFRAEVLAAKSDLERLLIASKEIERLRKEQALSAEAISALSKDNAFLQAQVRFFEAKQQKQRA